MIIDTHAHLADVPFTGTIPETLRAMEEKGVEAVISIGCSVTEARESLKLTKAYPNIFSTAGLYPHEDMTVPEYGTPFEAQLEEISTIAQDARVVAVGECGFDFSPAPPTERMRTREEQEILFRKQIELARNLHKPIVIHSRKATEDTLRVLTEEMQNSPFQGVWHCFGESPAIAEKALEIGLHISFTGIITYKSGKLLAEVVKLVPLERACVETDAPFLVPEPARSSGILRNEPSHVTLIVQKIAEIKGVSYDEVASKTTHTARRLFQLPTTYAEKLV